MTLTPGPYLWRMRPEDEYRLVEVFHDKNNGAMFCMCGSNYTHRPTQGHEFVRLVPAEEVEKAFVEARSCGIGAGYRCEHGVRWPHECKECADLEFARWQNSRARRVATGEEVNE